MKFHLPQMMIYPEKNPISKNLRQKEKKKKKENFKDTSRDWINSKNLKNLTIRNNLRSSKNMKLNRKKKDKNK
jgi:hypothetical protein